MSNIKAFFCIVHLFLMSFSAFSESYSILYRQAETKNETIYKLLEKNLQFSKDQYCWDIMEVRFTEDSQNDTIITVEYSKRGDFYSPLPSSRNKARLFTVLANDTIYISGNLAHSFFKEILDKNQLSVDIESENVRIELLPTKRFIYRSGNLYSGEKIVDRNPAYHLLVVPYLENKHTLELNHVDLTVIDSFRDLSVNKILLEQLKDSDYSCLFDNENNYDYKDAPFVISDYTGNNPIVTFFRTSTESIGVLLLLKNIWHFYILSLSGNKVQEEMTMKGYF